MSVAILINNSEKAAYITWSPTPCRLKTDRKKREIILRNKSTNLHGRVVFLTTPDSSPREEIRLKLKGDGKAVIFYIAGFFDHASGKGYASLNDRDTCIEAVDGITGTLLDEKVLMVRVRKNAEKLSPAERDRFLSALVLLHNRGRYTYFRNMHLSSSGSEIHGRSCFLVWHRAFLLDLERRLQEIDPAISLPYWKFDEAAPNVFSRDFMGAAGSCGAVDLSAANPLLSWQPRLFEGGSPCGIRRAAMPAGEDEAAWDPARQGAAGIRYSEDQAINLGSAFAAFRLMECDPQGSAHASFAGQICDVLTAMADPLFLLLHGNVDRIWARWQWALSNFNPGLVRSYPNQGSGESTSSFEKGIGSYTRDTMWPWNGEAGPLSRTMAWGSSFPNSGMVRKPGKQPKVGDMIDYQGQFKLAANLNYAYDDVPYEFENGV